MENNKNNYETINGNEQAKSSYLYDDDIPGIRLRRLWGDLTQERIKNRKYITKCSPSTERYNVEIDMKIEEDIKKEERTINLFEFKWLPEDDVKETWPYTWQDEDNYCNSDYEKETWPYTWQDEDNYCNSDYEKETWPYTWQEEENYFRR